MWPKPIPQSLRAVRTFELITPAGRVYHFPRPSLLQRLLKLLWSYADITAVSVAIFALLYIAGLAAEMLEPLTLNVCDERIRRPIGG
jgi:hypothetical protein